jgi:membrane-associated phospholipid phosphatase
MKKIYLALALSVIGIISRAQNETAIVWDHNQLKSLNTSTFLTTSLKQIPHFQLYDTVPQVADSVAVPRSSKKYHVDFWGTFGFSVLATAADIYAIPKIIHSKKDLTVAELQALNPSAFNGFDSWALNLDYTQRDKFYKISDITLPGIIIVSGGLLAFDKSINKDWLNIMLMYYQMHAITFSIYNFSFFGPAFQNKYRPVVYYNQFPMQDRLGGNQRNSMYSGHVATSAASTFFLVKVYSDYHPEIGHKKLLLYGLASIPPLIEGYFRVKALAHFPTDVMVGFMIGSACGIIVPEMHRIKKKNVQLDISFSSMGTPELGLRWTPQSRKQRELLNR